jgi:hypothetical protein
LRYSNLSSKLFSLIALTPVLAGILLAVPSGAEAGSNFSRSTATTPSPIQDFNLADFGAVGDGLTDNGPALQSALNAVAAAGGGTLFVPAGRYAIVTPVSKDFTGTANAVTIAGVESLTPVPPPQASGNELTAGLNLTSEFLPRTGETQYALHIRGLKSFLIKDIAFVGTPDVTTDATVTLVLNAIDEAIVRHCEFYGLSSLVAGGAIILNYQSGLSVEQSVFLGSAANSGVYAPIIQNIEWKGIAVANCVFADYGQRPELYGKLGYGAPYSWINVGNASAITSDSPRREVVVRDTFFDEGGFVGIASVPYFYNPPSAPIDLLYISNIFMNVSNLATTGNYLDQVNSVLIESAHYGWSHNADSAVDLQRIGEAILSRVECVAAANRIRASASTGRLTVIDSVYTYLASLAQTTRVIPGSGPDVDPVLYVRQQFENTLGRDPDAAAHFYWSRRILQCEPEDESCIADERAALQTYLASAPAPKFTISGRITNESGERLQGIVVRLSGSQASTTVTDANGDYRFASLPTSGIYTVSAEKQFHTLAPQTFSTPNGDCTAHFTAVFNRHSISGRVMEGANGLTGVLVSLSGAEASTAVTDSTGNFSFDELPAGQDYQVSATKQHYSFAPQSFTFNDLNGNAQTNFSATLNRHAVRGNVTYAGGAPAAGVTMTLSGAQSATTTTDSNGSYVFANLPAGASYTVTPTKAHHSFSSSSLTFNNLSADVSGNFAATRLNYVISGRVTVGSLGLEGATISFSGTHSGQTTTNSLGNYSFSVPAEGSYTVTPSKEHYTISPASTTVTNLTSNQTANFTGTLNRHVLRGRVVNVNNTGIAGAGVALSGAESATATTDSAGDFVFNNLPAGGNYTVTPSLTYHVMSPASVTFSNLGPDQHQTFVATLAAYSISGRILNGAGAPLAGATVTLLGTLGPISTVVTGTDGNYTFSSLPAGANYTVQVSRPNSSFVQSSTSFSPLSSNQTGVNFVGTIADYTISGRVTTGSGNLSGVVMTLSGTQSKVATTDAAGAYSFTVQAEGNYTVTPSLTHYTFSPAARTLTNLANNQTADFAATLNRHTVRGRVNNINNTGIPGVTVTLSGSESATATTNGAGDFAFNNLPAGGNYTITPSFANHVISPASATYSNLGADQQGTFVASLATYSITGRVVNGTAAGLTGTTVTLVGALGPISTFVVGADGNYTFNSLPAGAAYTLVASKPNHVFAPPNRDFSPLSSNQSGADFVGTLVNYTISGRVTTSSGNLSGVTVTLSGTQSGQTTTDEAGIYSFNVPAEGSYTVTPSKTNYSFGPANASFNNLSGNRMADFSANLPSFIEFSAASFESSENSRVALITVLRTGDTSGPAEVTYSASDMTARQGRDLSTIIGTLRFAPGETSRTLTLFITDDALAESVETINLALSNPSGATLGSRSTTTFTINDNDATSAGPNPIEDAQFFVRQHYRDFLNREPDEAGLAFWTGQITSCGSDLQCVEVRRINVSAAFFLSIEFKETGYFVHRLYKASYQRPPRRVEEFLFDTRAAGEELIVGAPGWEEKLEANKRAFTKNFVERPAFIARYPLTLTPSQFVNALNANIGSTLTADESAAAIAEFAGATSIDDASSRARAVRRVAESSAFSHNETNQAFVLMQYFGYLQRNPDDLPDLNLDGYLFWLSKLNQFGGDYQQAEMVKAFIASIEYRERFGR